MQEEDEESEVRRQEDSWAHKEGNHQVSNLKLRLKCFRLWKHLKGKHRDILHIYMLLWTFVRCSLLELDVHKQTMDSGTICKWVIVF